MSLKDALLICLAIGGLISSVVTIILLVMTARKINREIDFNWINPEAIRKINRSKNLTCFTFTLLIFILLFLLH